MLSIGTSFSKSFHLYFAEFLAAGTCGTNIRVYITIIVQFLLLIIANFFLGLVLKLHRFVGI